MLICQILKYFKPCNNFCQRDSMLVLRHSAKMHHNTNCLFFNLLLTHWPYVFQMEDFGLTNAHRLLNRYRDDYCVFNDDVQATAAAVVAGLMVACNRITKQKLKDNTYLFLGAGSVSLELVCFLIVIECC